MVKYSKAVLVAAVLTLLLAFNFFEIFPPISSRSLSLDIEFGDSPARPYILRVKVERITVTSGVPRPVARAAVSLNEMVSLTNSNGYAFFTTSPGKHVVTVSSPQSLFPTYSTDVEVSTRVTELVVRFVEHRLKPEIVDVVVDAASQTSLVTFTYLPPKNTTFFVGQPYVTFVNLDNHIKRFSGEVIIPYLADAAIQYSGPFTQIQALEEPVPATSVANVQDMIQLVVIDESFIIAYTVEATLLKME